MHSESADTAAGSMPAPLAFEAVVEMATSLRGSGEAFANLSELRRLLLADRATVLRIEGEHVRRVCVSDRTAGQLFSDRRPPCLADRILKASEYTLIPGTALFLSDFLKDGYSAGLEDAVDLLDGTAIHDVALVILEIRDGGCDVIEFQFRASIRSSTDALLASMAPALALAWSRRLPGSAHAMMRRTRARPATEAQSVQDDLLGPENPANLSRSEFRICAMMREGMMTKVIAEQLGIRGTTLRSHLHSIYSKTGASGQVDLLHRLSSRAREGGSDVIVPRAAGTG